MNGSKTLFPADSLYFFSPWSELKPAEWKYPKNPLIGYDQVLQVLPFHEAVARAFAAGELPLWNSRVLFGTPLLASTTAAVFYPLTLLSAVFPLWLALNLQAMAKLFIAGFFAYRWLKLFCREEGPAVFAAAGAMFCSFNIVWLNHPQSNISVLLPAAYYYTEKLVRRPRWSYALGLLIVICLQLLGGHMKSAFLAAVGTGLYFLVRLILVRRQDRHAKVSPSCLLFASAYLLGTLLAAAQLLPFLEFLDLSYTYDHLSGSRPGVLSPHYLLLLLNPDLLGHPAAGINWGSINYNEGAIYTGLPVLFVVLLTLPTLFRRFKPEAGADPVKPPLVVGLCGINGLLLLLIFGWKPLAELAGILPLFKLSDLHRLLLVFQINMVFAAGLSFALLLKRREGAPTVRHLVWVAAILIISLAGLVFSPARWAENADYLFFPIGHFAGFLIATVLLLFVFLRGKIGKKLFSWCLCLVLFADLFLAYRDYNPTVDKKWLSHPLPPSLAKIRDSGEVFRVAGLDLQLPPNSSMLAGLSDISGYGNPIGRRTHQFLVTLFDGMNAKRGMRNLITLGGAREVELLKWLNVKYILSPRELRTGGLENRLDLVKVYESPAVVIYENQGFFPRAYMVWQYEKLDAEAVLARLGAAPEDLQQKAYLEKDLPDPQRLQLAATGMPVESSVQILDYGENRVSLEVFTESSGLLVLTDLNYPGWEAFVDGRPRRIHQANYLFRAIFLEKGSHLVEFRYRPASMRWGIIISFLTLGAVGAITLWTKRRRRD